MSPWPKISSLTFTQLQTPWTPGKRCQSLQRWQRLKPQSQCVVGSRGRSNVRNHCIHGGLDSYGQPDTGTGRLQKSRLRTSYMHKKVRWASDIQGHLITNYSNGRNLWKLIMIMDNLECSHVKNTVIQRRVADLHLSILHPRCHEWHFEWRINKYPHWMSAFIQLHWSLCTCTW